MARCFLVYQWDCPDPTGSHLLDCPLPRECGGPKWEAEARPLSFQSQSSRRLFCLSSHAQTVRSCPQPAGRQLLRKMTNVPYYQPKPAYTRPTFPSTLFWDMTCVCIYILKLQQNYQTANLVCSEEVGCLQDLPQLFQLSQVTPLEGKVWGLQKSRQQSEVMTEWEAHTHHNVRSGLNKTTKCFHHLLSTFCPFEVCVTVFICLLQRICTDYSIGAM